MQREYWHTPIAIIYPSLPGLRMRSDQAPQTPESRLWTWPEIPTSAASLTQVEPALLQCLLAFQQWGRSTLPAGGRNVHHGRFA